MGITDIFNKIELPDAISVSTEAKKLKTEMKKTDINTLNVRYFFKNTPYFLDTVATLYRTTNFTIGIIEVPELLGFILADDSIYFNKTNKQEIIHVKEGYPFSINLSSELTREFDEFKKTHDEIKEYTVPLMINQIPIKAIRIKLQQKLPGFPDEMDITQKVIYQLGFVKILSKINKEKIQGAFILVIIGFLAGSLFGMSAAMFFLQ